MEQQTTFCDKVIIYVKDTDKKIEFSCKHSQSDTNILAVYYIDDAVSVPPNTSHISSGSHCDLSGSLFKPESASNPHQFDYRTYLLQQGIVYQLYIDDISEVTCEPSYVFHLMNKIRLQLFQSTLEKLDDEVTVWFHTLVLDIDSRIDEAVLDIFQRWSLSHILAISGLHVGIIVGLLYVALVRSTLWTKETSQQRWHHLQNKNHPYNTLYPGLRYPFFYNVQFPHHFLVCLFLKFLHQNILMQLL